MLAFYGPDDWHTVTSSALRAAFTGNTFLDSLPLPTRARLMPLLEKRTLKRHQVLAEPGNPIPDVYFPIQSVISTVMHTRDGEAVEVGLTGHEGLTPVAVAFGSITSTLPTVTQISDSAMYMNAQAFLDAFATDAVLKQRALLYAEYSFSAATHFTACNVLHDIKERYARWILMASDRVGSSRFYLTQDYSGEMLGVRRSGVSVVAGILSAQGLISYKRGLISINDRSGLEAVACECYTAVNTDLHRLMGYGPRRAALTGP